ncbi:MAG: glycoside hydrolase family 2 protein [Anaerocolumna sp.]
MIRLFEQHKIRKENELEGLWNFTTADENHSYKLSVPGCWEQHPRLSAYRGKGIYTKIVSISEPGAVRLEFKGVSHTADVYFDGVHIAHHYNAYTPFHSIVKDVSVGDHEIKVIVDNTFGEHSSLHVPNDYYTYGGIIRPVSFAGISETYIEKLHFTPTLENGVWNGLLKVTIYNLSSKAKTIKLVGTLDNIELNFETIEVPEDSHITVSLKQQFPEAIAWSHENPKLYTLNTVLYSNNLPVDDLIERVGFRTIQIDRKNILLNGEKVFLKGFNRHEDYATVGCAIPFQLMLTDMDLMEDMGVNALRTCHYPNDERFLDLCDEKGIMVWEENHARGLELPAMLNPNFDRQCRDCIDEMIDNHYNHPSIIIWGILNECGSETEEGRIKYKAQYEQIKELDDTRPTTSATCKHFKDICLDLPDIVSYNIYSGWYEDVPVKMRNDKELEWINSTPGAGKPMIVSEFGGAAMYGYRDRTHCKWSEERQADILEECLSVYMTDENISGVFIWQFADCRITEEGMYSKTRPRCHNNKGVVDDYRRPKMAYDTVKKFFHGL